MTRGNEALSAPTFRGNLELEEAPCPMGCPRDDLTLFVGRDRLYGFPGSFPVVRCRRCDLMRTTPRPPLHAIGGYYPDLYGPYRPAEGVVKALSRPTPFERWMRAVRLDGTRDLLPPALPAGRALEIGCASGGFLAKLRSRGWDVLGVEPSSAAAQHAQAQGLSVHIGPVETAPEVEQPLDLLVASHALEHLHQPFETLRRMRRWARVGAWLTLAVPDAGSLLFKRFGAAWYDLDLPRHLFHFTPKTMAAMLAATGWKMERVRSQGTLNSLMGSVGYLLSDRASPSAKRWGEALLAFPESRSPMKKVLAPVFEMVLKLARQTGRMVIWAQAV